VNQHRVNLLSIYHAALEVVQGRESVAAWLRDQPQKDCRHVVAIGKAAAAMASGALDVLDGQLDRLLVITRHGYTCPALAQHNRVLQLEAGHPLPDQASLDAGRALLDFIAEVPASAPLLFLISGGTSALVEVLPEGLTLADLQHINRWLLGSGLPIQEMNTLRCVFSAIKGGRLATYLCGRPAQVLLISDVPEDNPAIIGSGLLYPAVNTGLDMIIDVPDWLDELLPRVVSGSSDILPPSPTPAIPHYIVASADSARQAAVQKALQLEYEVFEHRQRVYGDIHEVAQRLVHTMMESGPGLHIWSGETTVMLPETPGDGGRCQSLALAIALIMAGNSEAIQGASPGWCLLAAGSDGSDGAGEAAGALVDGLTLSRIKAAGFDPEQCLARADAGRCLKSAQDLIFTGPTGTNVMDVMLGLRLI